MAKSKNHEATTTGIRDNRRPEACCKAIDRMVSKPVGCNESERRLASRIKDNRKLSCFFHSESNMCGLDWRMRPRIPAEL